MAALEFEAANKFALDLHKCLKSTDKFAGENLFYSPASLLIALAMTSLGTRGNTALELMKVLHVDSVSSDDLGKSMKNFIDSLNRASDENNRLLIANRLFVQKSFEILSSFQ